MESDQGEWEEAFAKYKLIPQFQQINPTMDLSGFKFIFFWEYFHRLIGRLTGVVVMLPGLIFIVRKTLSPYFTKKVILGFLLGLAQGFMGWFMVSSGLSQLVYVSHLRLAAHLMLALFILSYWTTVYLDWKNKDSAPVAKTGSSVQSLATVYLLAFLLIIQLFYGAFVAGLKGGYSYNTFPTMSGEWIPTLLFMNNIVTTQFIHRWLAAILLGVAIFAKVKDSKGNQFLALLTLQFLLGVFTLVMAVPVVIGTLHQMVACILVISLTVWVYRIKKVRS